MAAADRVTVVFEDGPRPRRRELQANGIYSFHGDGDNLDLAPEPLSETSAGQPAWTPTPEPPSAVCIIPVKILADEKEPTLQRVWEKRYRKRLAAASEIIERCCRVRFQVVDVGTWSSDDAAHKLDKLIAEFERKVRPAPARLAIGFTGQYESLREDKRVGETRAPFHPYILIRERGRQITEVERLQILVHELGHFLGAAHSPDEYSVMRADLGKCLARSRDFPIGFDAPNTLVLWLVGEELRTRPLTHIGQLPPASKVQVRAVYASLAAALPGDPTAPQFLAALDQSRHPRAQQARPAVFAIFVVLPLPPFQAVFAAEPNSGREPVRRSATPARAVDADKVIAECTEAIRMNPKDARAYCTRGMAYENKGDHDKAIADFTAAILLDPKYAAAYSNRGSAQSSKGEYEKALADLNDALRLDPNNAPAYNNRGGVYEKKGDYGKAIADFDEAIRLDPKDGPAYYNRGSTHEYMGDHDKAIADFTEAIRLEPKFAPAYQNRGVAYECKGDYDRAIADHTEAIRLNPKYARAYCNRGVGAWTKATTTRRLPTSPRRSASIQETPRRTFTAARPTRRRAPTTRRSPTSARLFGWRRNTPRRTTAAAGPTRFGALTKWPLPTTPRRSGSTRRIAGARPPRMAPGDLSRRASSRRQAGG